jgi:hypothetical protein
VTVERSGFVAVVAADELRPSQWDPHAYRASAGARLGDHVVARRPGRATGRAVRPLEYRDIARGPALAHAVDLDEPAPDTERLPAVAESTLLLGTLRAYLGNVVVTPRARWLGVAGPLAFPLRSEFVEVVPRDGLVWFWWALLRSPRFLAALPPGGGGTRPRLSIEALVSTPVDVPALATRRSLDRRLGALAARAFRDAARARAALARLD